MNCVAQVAEEDVVKVTVSNENYLKVSVVVENVKVSEFYRLLNKK